MTQFHRVAGVQCCDSLMGPDEGASFERSLVAGRLQERIGLNGYTIQKRWMTNAEACLFRLPVLASELTPDVSRGTLTSTIPTS
jgi:hypothetical protein